MTHPSGAEARRKRELAGEVITHLLRRYRDSHQLARLAWCGKLAGVADGFEWAELDAVRHEIGRAKVWGVVRRRLRFLEARDLFAADFDSDITPLGPDTAAELYERDALRILVGKAGGNWPLSPEELRDQLRWSWGRVRDDMARPASRHPAAPDPLGTLRDAWHEAMDGEVMPRRLRRLAARVGLSRAEMADALRGAEFRKLAEAGRVGIWMAHWPADGSASPVLPGLAERVWRVVADDPMLLRRGSVGDIGELVGSTDPVLTLEAVGAAFPDLARETRRTPRLVAPQPAAPIPPAPALTPPEPPCEAATPAPPAAPESEPTALVDFAALLARLVPETKQGKLIGALIDAEGSRGPRDIRDVVREVYGRNRADWPDDATRRKLVSNAKGRLGRLSHGALDIVTDPKRRTLEAVARTVESAGVPDIAGEAARPHAKRA